MARYQLVRLSGAPASTGWTIERVIPGEAPVPIPFRGYKVQAKAEIHRLILAERTEEDAPMASNYPKRHRDANDKPKKPVP